MSINEITSAHLGEVVFLEGKLEKVVETPEGIWFTIKEFESTIDVLYPLIENEKRSREFCMEIDFYNTLKFRGTVEVKEPSKMFIKAFQYVIKETSSLGTYLDLMEDFKNFTTSSDLEWKRVFNKYERKFSSDFNKLFSRLIVTIGQAKEILYDKKFTEEEKLKSIIKMNLKYSAKKETLLGKDFIVTQFDGISSVAMLKKLTMEEMPPLAFSEEVEAKYKEIVSF
jgi:hypothetical protein